MSTVLEAVNEDTVKLNVQEVANATESQFKADGKLQKLNLQTDFINAVPAFKQVWMEYKDPSCRVASGALIAKLRAEEAPKWFWECLAKVTPEAHHQADVTHVLSISSVLETSGPPVLLYFGLLPVNSVGRILGMFLETPGCHPRDREAYRDAVQLDMRILLSAVSEINSGVTALVPVGSGWHVIQTGNAVETRLQ